VGAGVDRVSSAKSTGGGAGGSDSDEEDGSAYVGLSLLSPRPPPPPPLLATVNGITTMRAFTHGLMWRPLSVRQVLTMRSGVLPPCLLCQVHLQALTMHSGVLPMPPVPRKPAGTGI
jgi:hypothetical protein